MKMFKDQIVLIKKQAVKDELGQTILQEASHKKVFGEIQSTTSNDFFKANQNNIKLTCKVVIYKHNFKNETHALINLYGEKMELSILRMYDLQDDFIELHLSEMLGGD